MTHICVSKINIIGSDNGLSPGRRQAIIWTNAGILLIGPCGNKFLEILIQENAFQNVVWKMAAILSRPQCVDGYSWLSSFYQIATLSPSTDEEQVERYSCWPLTYGISAGLLWELLFSFCAVVLFRDCNQNLCWRILASHQYTIYHRTWLSECHASQLNTEIN